MSGQTSRVLHQSPPQREEQTRVQRPSPFTGRGRPAGHTPACGLVKLTQCDESFRCFTCHFFSQAQTNGPEFLAAAIPVQPVVPESPEVRTPAGVHLL